LEGGREGGSAQGRAREEPVAVGGFFYRTRAFKVGAARNAEITVDAAAGAEGKRQTESEAVGF